ncbi:hypothetical protein [Bacillus pseudomycoides]|uniref:hypothetical protein n=1 Tax=Bacillus cereus group TaxID=86661 RepID=UPI001FB505B2|nr:hypothetical protein [Bacillus pseudomycoides]
MLEEMLSKVSNKNNFTSIQEYIDFASYFLEYIQENKQAVIVSQNEHHYNFYQYGKEVDYRVTRPFNSNILYSIEDFEINKNILLNDLSQLKRHKDKAAITDRTIINRSIYTIQQSIGFGLDALPAGKSNTARKLAGDLFERLILLLFIEVGINAKGGVVKVPVVKDGKKIVDMNYQHDLIVDRIGEKHPCLIGSVKTTSKDRLAKVFMDKFLYSRLTDTEVPHIAIFLHDVQRKSTKQEGKYGISQTFLTGSFKGYTIKLNPLDGVYYFDPRPIMQTDEFFKEHIQTFDHLICDDIWDYIQ